MCFWVKLRDAAPIPSTTAVPSAGLSGEHPVQICVVGLDRHDGELIPSTTVVPSAGLFGQALYRGLDICLCDCGIWVQRRSVTRDLLTRDRQKFCSGFRV